MVWVHDERRAQPMAALLQGCDFNMTELLHALGAGFYWYFHHNKYAQTHA
jgi:hypothetical protein